MGFFDEPFKKGKWREWLKNFEVGEERVEFTDIEDVKRIRVNISHLRAQNYYFRTSFKDNEFAVKRISLDEWLDQPKRKY